MTINALGTINAERATGGYIKQTSLSRPHQKTNEINNTSIWNFELVFTQIDPDSRDSTVLHLKVVSTFKTTRPVTHI